jgi:U32 family peptidase
MKIKPIGEVTHYFSNIKVAVIKLSAPLAEGDKIRIVGGEDTDFEQIVKSMQADHEKINKAKKGSEIGLKVKDRVREGYKVFKG